MTNSPACFIANTPKPHGPPEQQELYELGVEAWAFHQSLAGYTTTPLHALPALARTLGVGSLHLKDESPRLGLNAFKGLGASFAIHRWLALHPTTEPITFSTATDGNHGRAVAWTARTLGHRAVVFVPAHTVPARIAAIRGEGAEVVVVPGAYEDAVRLADARSREEGWTLIQDLAHGEYIEIARWIAAGYTTHLRELEPTLHPAATPEVNLVLLHAGVGTWAASVCAYYWHRYGSRRPRMVVVEPTEADCLYQSARAGTLARAQGSLETMMAGLNCGWPSSTAWEILRDGVDGFLTIPDSYAAAAMRRLAHPADGDPRVVAGETGAAGIAGLMALATAPELAAARAALAIGPGSRVLVFSTEGATDPDNWTRVVEG